MAKIMVVTGAGRGIGAAVARLAGARGYDVCVNYARSQRPAEAIASEIRAKGQRAVALQADGRIVVAGDIDGVLADRIDGRFAVARYRAG